MTEVSKHQKQYKTTDASIRIWVPGIRRPTSPAAGSSAGAIEPAAGPELRAPRLREVTRED